MLAITICDYDFVCFYYQTSFFEINKENNQLVIETIKNVLPNLSIRDFIKDTKVEEVIVRFTKNLKSGYLAEGFTEDDVLNELYHIKYIIPQHGRSITATLVACDYLPTNEVAISEEDRGILENGFKTIALKYDKTLKKFVK